MLLFEDQYYVIIIKQLNTCFIYFVLKNNNILYYFASQWIESFEKSKYEIFCNATNFWKREDDQNNNSPLCFEYLNELIEKI